MSNEHKQIAGNEDVRIKWKMIDRNTFEAEFNGYEITVGSGFIGWYWDIKFKGILFDVCYRHSPTHNELAAKVQAERALKTIISKQFMEQNKPQ